MKGLNVLIVEDEPIIAKDLSFIIEDLGYIVQGIAHNKKDTLELLKQSSVDLVLLDINLENERDGIEIGKHLHANYPVPFIYLTAYSDDETLQLAKQTFPMGFLVKPIDEKDLKTTMEISINNYNEHIIHKEIHPKNPFKDILFIKDQNKLFKVKIQDIILAEASNNYTIVFTKDKKFVMSSTLKVIEERLAKWDFIRVHRSYLVNPEKIESIAENHIVIGTHKIPISRRMKDSFLDKINTL